MNVHRGEVVLVPFPQGPGQAPKRRPALVVQSDHNNGRLGNSIFAMITSNTSLAGREATQLLIDISTLEGQQSGLAHTSAVKCENLHTLPTAVVQRKLGSIPSSLLRRVDDCLRAALGI
jgi:mRNA interferase MazF